MRPPWALRPSEIRVLELKLIGKSSSIIAELFGLDERTPTTQMKQAMERYGFTSEKQMIAFVAAKPWLLRNWSPHNDNRRDAQRTPRTRLSPRCD